MDDGLKNGCTEMLGVCTFSTDSVLNLSPLYSVVSKNFVSVLDTSAANLIF